MRIAVRVPNFHAAEALVEGAMLKAVELANRLAREYVLGCAGAEDPAVLDSLGWVNYRLGNLDEAERHLRAALARFPDHEVAAHLGEVLWVQGKQREAREVWASALEAKPDSPILRATIKRLTGSEKP